MTISRWILIRMRNVSDKSCRENQNEHFTFGNCPPPPPPRKSYSLWDNVQKHGRARGATNYVSIWRVRVACWINKATCTPTLPSPARTTQQWIANAPQYYVIRTLFVFWSIVQVN
jgi:hypothetical protein